MILSFKVSVIFALLLSLVACNGGKNKTNIELMQGMFDQVSLKAQDWDPLKNGAPAHRLPPEGTVPMNKKFYKYEDPMSAGTGLKNPYAGVDSMAYLERGEKLYNINCAVCHGVKGDGKGDVGGKTAVGSKMLLAPPTLLSQNVKSYPDGRLFHVLVKGQGLMGGYGAQIQDEKDRWSVVQYIRGLQKAN